MSSTALGDFVPTAESLSLVEDVTCLACGCACDDIALKVENHRILEARRACGLGKQWFSAGNTAPQAVCTIEGRPASLDDGLRRAAEILVAARYPLIYGLAQATTDAQRGAVAIADRLGGVIDTPASAAAGPTGTTFQGVGDVSCSLGEIRHRADLLIFWGADPIVTHPRFLTRYGLTAKGDFLPAGRADRTCVVVNPQPTRTAETADVVIQPQRGSDFEAVWTLRALVAGASLDADQVKAQTGVALAVWRDLADRMLAARYGAILLGVSPADGPSPHLQSDAVSALVRDLNARTRFVSRRLGGAGNLSGATNVLTWTTGYPFAVDLSHGYPRFSPGEFSAPSVLTRGECDAVLLVGADGFDELSDAARERLARLPRVEIESCEHAASGDATVVIRPARFGICSGGTIYRMDDVPLPLRPAWNSDRPSDAEVLAALDREIRKLQGPS